MPIPKNSIDTLFIWVHPDFRPVDPETRRSWMVLVELLKTETNCALIETPYRQSLLTKKGIEETIRTSGQETQGYTAAYQRTSLAGLARIECYAQKVLGERYVRWHRNWVYNNREDPKRGDYDIIKEKLNVEERDFVKYPYQRIFRDIYCYGLELSSCVHQQAHGCNLWALTHHIGTLGDNISFSELVRTIPRRIETLETIKRIDQKPPLYWWDKGRTETI